MSNYIKIDLNKNKLEQIIKKVKQKNSSADPKKMNIRLMVCPNKNGRWEPVGIASKSQGFLCYPKTNCRLCGPISEMKIRVSQEKDVYAVYCRNCTRFCNYLSYYDIQKEEMKNTIEKVLLT